MLGTNWFDFIYSFHFAPLIINFLLPSVFFAQLQRPRSGWWRFWQMLICQRHGEWIIELSTATSIAWSREICAFRPRRRRCFCIASESNETVCWPTIISSEESIQLPLVSLSPHDWKHVWHNVCGLASDACTDQFRRFQDTQSCAGDVRIAQFYVESERKIVCAERNEWCRWTIGQLAKWSAIIRLHWFGTSSRSWPRPECERTEKRIRRVFHDYWRSAVAIPNDLTLFLICYWHEEKNNTTFHLLIIIFKIKIELKQDICYS